MTVLAFVSPSAGVPVPTVADVRAWTGVSASAITDAQLQQVLDAELAGQASVCTVEPYRPDQFQAVLRRCARHMAARGVPLGLFGGGESEHGPARLPQFDSEIERLEGPTRRVVFG